MIRSTRQSGLSLFELLIATAVIGITAALALPAYNTYIETANMTKVTANFEQGIRVARLRFSKNKTNLALGLDTVVPTDTAGWLEILNEGNIEAPGGGPAYIASNNKKTARGDPITGAIGVQWRKKKGDLRLWRPLYLSLREQRATITTETIDIKLQRQPN